MKRIAALMVTALVVTAAMLGASQQRMSASAAWVKAPAAGATTTSAFVVIENPTMYEVYVVSVSTPAAGRAAIVRGADRGTAVKELAVPAYGQVELKPGEMEIRLDELTGPMKVGDAVEITLATDGGDTVTVSAEVK